MLYLASDKEDVLALLIARSGIKGKEDEDAISKRKLDPYKGDKYKLPTFRISIGEGKRERERERERERWEIRANLLNNKYTFSIN